jgi:hypothetical protein
LHYAFGKFGGASGLGDAVQEAQIAGRVEKSTELVDRAKIASLDKDIKAAEAMPAATVNLCCLTLRTKRKL